MAGRARRMEPVARVMHEREREAARRLGEAQARLRARLAERERLEGYRAEYARSLQGAAAVSGARLRDYRVFLERINRALGELERAVEQARAEVEACRRHWLEAQRRSRSVGLAVERLQGLERREEARREQRESDGHAARRLRRG
ncbi:flagellar FliJ protein [Inmirania thermothiophila]|uniref:Flagellar FliJ protein n=2 Tax=Inmirania thermothiophila TaxID=1750597 RepID=A0A3N1Y7Z2_9GAMM|nr:flagellar FliJ protein [Inmirania thermothiophila]